ncbi:MAG: hypothetical protein QXW97_04030 [Candidatus Pacearchaeota archaeon]
MEKKIKMIAAASEALKFLIAHPKSTDEEVIQYVTNFIMNEKIKDEDIKFGMIAAATETYKIFMQNSKMTEKEYLRKIMERIPIIIENSKSIN